MTRSVSAMSMFARVAVQAAVIGVLLLCAAPRSSAGGDSPETSFEKFCAEWMGKLATRERDNQKQIQWIHKEQSVEGEYVGYSSQHQCFVKPNADKQAVPVGKIIYQEFRYQKSGASPEQASLAQPTALEAVEVTEIFRYAKGKWLY